MKTRLWLIYILIVVFGMVGLYAIFNVGNPHSLLRLFIKTDVYDIYIVMGVSLIVFFLGFLVFYFRQQEGYTNLLWTNKDRIRSLRGKGYTDEQIAEDLLLALGMKKGYRYNLAKKRLVLELSSIKIVSLGG